MSARTTVKWQTVHAELLRRIREREWGPGSQIPGEAALAGEFGCARTTVNRALRELANSGFVERRRKAGTRVAAHPVARARLEIPVTRLEVESRGQKWRHTLLDRRTGTPSAAIAARMSMEPQAEALYLRTLHFADNHPLMYEDRWINLQILPQAREIDFTAISANEWLVLNAAYTAGDMVFSAANATQEQAQLLDAQENQALFMAERITWNEGRAVTFVRLCHAPGYKLFAAL